MEWGGHREIKPLSGHAISPRGGVVGDSGGGGGHHGAACGALQIQNRRPLAWAVQEARLAPVATPCGPLGGEQAGAGSGGYAYNPVPSA
jgi:hypothetical protein